MRGQRDGAGGTLTFLLPTNGWEGRRPRARDRGRRRLLRLHGA